MRGLFVIVLIVCFWGNSVVSAQWDKYPTFDGYISMMEEFESNYPELCKIIEIGESVQGRKLLVAKISNNVETDEKEPSFLYHAMIHGDETLGYILMLHLIDYLLTNYATDTLVTKLVDNIEIYIDPLVNPDGTYYGGNSTVSGARRNNANNKDLNRNWPCWCMEGSHKYYGMYDSWEPEVKAVKDFFESDNFVMSADLHSGTENVMYPSRNIEEVDKEWYLYVCHMYADTASKYSPSGYDLEVINDNDTLSYNAHGSWMYYPVIYRSCRNITLELSVRKLLNESDLNDHWDYNYRSLLKYIEQVLFGIQGMVSDSLTGAPLKAKAFVEDHDKDSSIVYSHLPHGDFYRPIFQGTYDVTFSAEGYKSKTIKGVQVENNEAIVLDVKLVEGQTDIINSTGKTAELTIDNLNGFVRITFNKEFNSNMEISIFDMSGKVIKKLNTETGVGKQTVVWDGLDNNGAAVSKGCYIVRIKSTDNLITKRFIFSR